MIPISILLGVLVAFCFGTSDYLSKKLTANVGFYRTAVYTLLSSGLLLIGPLAIIAPRVDLTLPSLGVALAIAVTIFAAFLLMYRAYQRGNLSIVSPTVNSFPIFSILFAVFILGVYVSLEETLALAGVIAGILLVSFQPGLSVGRRGITPGIPEALGASLFFAVGLSLLGYADVTFGVLVPSLSARLGGGLVGAGIALASGKDISPFGGRDLARVVAMACLEATGLLLFSLTFLYTGMVEALPIITTLAGMGVVFTVGFALAIARERLSLHYALGIVTLIASVSALLYLTA